MHTCRDRKIPTVAVYSDPDRLAHHVFMADEAVHIGAAPPAESYLNMDKMIDAALRSRADAIHPGWGFLAENEAFARKVIDAGLTWIGPSPEVISMLGDKIEAKALAKKANVPTIPGIDAVTDIGQIKAWMQKDGVAYPIMIKAASGGGGKGMVKVESDGELSQALARARSEARKSFGDDTILVEKYIERGGTSRSRSWRTATGTSSTSTNGNARIQRRNQKIIEEAPSPSLDENLRNEICYTATRLMREIGYTTAGTVEYIFDSATRKFYFLEVNTRLQVEHGITELITGLDIVGIMIDDGAGQEAALQAVRDPSEPVGARGPAERRGPQDLQPLLRPDHAAPDPHGAERAGGLGRVRGRRHPALLRFAVHAAHDRRRGPEPRYQRYGPVAWEGTSGSRASRRCSRCCSPSSGTRRSSRASFPRGSSKSTWMS